ncbi:hypothetical protein L248_1652 [Schleiferilactobacillus shenzhenensis LY-73]|uniref:Rha n=1 Tax=Schleiferilactobacillus shenzhenensis LY-73 TaxID=1231336 RepID=U4TKU8_9LACO|nr:hypothetical protein L248_1652 [Schleiferilactobacillus shenzhenensis LY-73]
MFSLGEYKDRSGKRNKMYYMNRDGFTFIAFGFTGQAADKFKLEYIQAFNSMEATLKAMPTKKLDPTQQAELAITREKTKRANALYRIAIHTVSDSAQ